MLVSDLLRYRDLITEKLEELTVVSQGIIDSDNILTQLLTVCPVSTADARLTHAKNELLRLTNGYCGIRDNIKSILQELDLEIDSLALSLHTDISLEFFHLYHSTDFQIDEDVVKIIRGRIHHNADWHYPGMQLGCSPAAKALTNEMVSNDPLYICDFKQEYIDQVCKQFNDVYIRRLRKYVIQNHNLSIIPQNQIGFIFSWMFFNYTNLETVKFYLKQILAILRPGGQMIFSYNNTDLLDSCIVAEKNGMSYITKRQLIILCQELGYEITATFDIPNDDYEIKWVSWIEIKKPGTLSSIKLSAVLGEVIAK